MKPCKHRDPLDGLGYVAAADKAEHLLKTGWKQRKCPACKLWVTWIKPTQLELLLAQEKEARRAHKAVGIQKIKLEVKLAKLRQKIDDLMTARAVKKLSTTEIAEALGASEVVPVNSIEHALQVNRERKAREQ